MNQITIIMVMLHLNPGQHASRVPAGWDTTASAISLAATSRRDAAMLLVIGWLENTYVTDGSHGTPFGVICCWHRNVRYRADTQPQAAVLALRLMNEGRAECHGDIRRAFLRYYAGRCTLLPVPRHESRAHRRMRVRAHRYSLAAERRYWQTLHELEQWRGR